MEFTTSRSCAALPEYEAEQARKRAEFAKRWLLAKQTTWLTLLTVAFLMFYLMEILHESMILLMTGF